MQNNDWRQIIISYSGKDDNMSEIRELADLFDKKIADKKLKKYTYTLVKSEKQELNVENGEFKLMRTVFNNYTSIKVFDGNRMGSAAGNDLSEEALEKLIEDGIEGAKSSPEDPCHDFAPYQGKEVFHQGVYEPDMDKFISRTREFLDDVKKEYPTVNVMASVASFDKSNWISRNSNGTEFEDFSGSYYLSIQVCAKEGEKTTSLDYTGFSMDNLDTPFIECADVRRCLDSVSKSVHPESLEGKFDGTVVMAPMCAVNFVEMLLGNYICNNVIIEGTSLWLDKVGEKVASDRLTVTIDPFDERIIGGEVATQDGFLAEKVTLFDKGVLKTHWLNLYAANKTGRPVVKNTRGNYIIEAGNHSLAEIVASVDKGILMGGFSGGEPGTNGEFSGVAKNSFLIENGKITKALTETMVNGNLGKMFGDIREISKEQICYGSCVAPYIAFDGIVISGK